MKTIRNRIIFTFVTLLIILGLASGWIFAEEKNTITTVDSNVAQIENSSMIDSQNNGSSNLNEGETESINSNVKTDTLSVGSVSNALIKNDNSLWTWGYNDYGQLGNGTTTNKKTPVKIMNDVKKVCMGGFYSAAIKSDDTLWMWGANAVGQLGNGTDEWSKVPIKIMDDVQSVSLSTSYSAAIKKDGSLWIWGGSSEKSMPEKIMNNVKEVSISDEYFAVIKNDDSLWMWGNNDFGQLGIGSTQSQSDPIEVMEDVKAIDLGSKHSAAIKNDNTLWMWGSNSNGEVGNNSKNDCLNPVKILDNVYKVSLADWHSAALKNDGSLWMWGDNDYHSLGIDSMTYSYVPLKIMDNVNTVDVGGTHSAVIKNDGTLWFWGTSEWYWGASKDTANTGLDSKVPIKIDLSEAMPLTITSFTNSITSNQKTNQLITFTLETSGGSGTKTATYYYKKDGENKTTIQTLTGDIGKCTYTPTEAGSYVFGVDVKDDTGLIMNKESQIYTISKISSSTNQTSLDSKIVNYWTSSKGNLSQYKYLINSGNYCHYIYTQQNDSSFQGKAELYFGNLFFEGSDGIRNGLTGETSKENAKKILIGLMEENDDNIKEMGYARAGTDIASVMNETLEPFLLTYGISSKDAQAAKTVLGNDDFWKIFDEKGYEGIVEKMAENVSGSNKASFAKAMEAYKVSDNLSNGLFALDIGLKEINWENTTIDRIYQYTAVKYADEEYLAMLGYLADNATYSVVKDAAYELKQQSEEPTEKALENLRKDAAGDQAWIIGDAIWQKTFDSCEYLKIAKIGFDLGVQFSNMFFHTADSVNTKDSMRSLSYIGQTLGEWSVDSWSKYLNTNDVSEKNKYAKQCVYATQMTWKVRKLGEECFRKWCVLFNQDKASNISLSVTSLLDDMDDFVNSTETTEDFQDYVNSSICCPVDIQVYRGNHIILTIKDGIESNGQIDGLKYEVVYNEVNKTYSKFIQMSKNQDYSLKLIGNDIGTVNCKVSETSVDGIISSKQFENLPIKKGTTIITNTINNLSELTYTVDKEGDGSNKKTCGFIDAKASSYVAVTGIVKLENVTKMSVGSKKALGIQVQPINASYQNVSWTSSNENVLSVNSEGVATAKSIGSSIITAKTEDGGYQLNYTIIVSTNPTVTYRTHVQNVGWQDYVSNSATSGTSGQSLRLEGINIKLENQNDLAGSIRYKTHIQNIGWEKSWNYDGAMSGTTGKSYRLEAIQIELTGEMANQYDIYYRVHAQNIGWMGWAKNGEQAGTAGYAYRLEAIQIELVKKGGSAPDASDSNTSEAFRHPMVQYQTHVQNIGWQGYVQDGAMSGTSGQSLRLEGIHINLSNQDYAGSIQYKTHVQNIGWQNWVSDGALSGTSGQSLRLEAIQIQLTGEMANHFDVYYRVHSQNIGWMGWAKNGEEAGTAGFAYRLEGIEIQLVQKDGAAPGLTDNHFVQR